MKTITKYEEIILNEIRDLPPPILQHAVKMLRSLKVGVTSIAKREAIIENGKTGFCGAWKDDRSAVEIIADISEHRSGFGRRAVDL